MVTETIDLDWEMEVDVLRWQMWRWCYIDDEKGTAIQTRTNTDSLNMSEHTYHWKTLIFI